MTIKITEESFLDERIGRSVAIYLINGIKLLGVLMDHDLDVVFLRPHGENDGGIQMLSKTAISTVVSVPAEVPRFSTDPLDGILCRSR